MSDLAAQYTDAPETRELIARLLDTGQRLPRWLENELLTGGDDVAEALIRLLGDWQTLLQHDRTAGFAPIYAAQILGKRRESAAVAPLLDVTCNVDIESPLYSAAIFALQEIGPPALEPTLRAIQAGRGPAGGKALAEVLSELGVHDNRVLRVLLDVFEQDPSLGASYLASYQDPAALELLHDAFADTPVDTDNPFANHVFTELAAAIDALGGELTALEQAKLNRATRLRRRAAEAILGAPASDESVTIHAHETDGEPDPDEPCWCGSGTKFKDCHGQPDRGVRQ